MCEAESRHGIITASLSSPWPPPIPNPSANDQHLFLWLLYGVVHPSNAPYSKSYTEKKHLISCSHKQGHLIPTIPEIILTLHQIRLNPRTRQPSLLLHPFPHLPLLSCHESRRNRDHRRKGLVRTIRHRARAPRRRWLPCCVQSSCLRTRMCGNSAFQHGRFGGLCERRVGWRGDGWFELAQGKFARAVVCRMGVCPGSSNGGGL